MKGNRSYKIHTGMIVNMLFFLCFMIYLKKLPIAIETQPFIIFFISAIYVLFRLKKITKIDVWLIIYLLVISSYLVVQLIISQTGIIAYFTYLVGPLIYLSMKNNMQWVSERLIKTVIVLYASICAVLLLKIPILYDFLNFFYDLFVPRSGWMDGSEIRGITLLAPEPSYFAFSAVLLLVALDIVALKGKQNLLFKLMVIGIAILTKSALVFLYIGLYLLFYYLKWKAIKEFFALKSRRFLFFGFALVLLMLPFVLFDNSRTVEVFTNIYSNFSSSASFESLLLKEVSGSTRFIINTLGFLSVEYAPFGWGLGEFQHSYHIVGAQFHNLMSNHEVLKEVYLVQAPMKAQTYGANIVGDIGLLALPFFIFTIRSVFKKNNTQVQKGLIVIIPLMLILVQAQISNPIPWVLLAVVNSTNLHEKAH